MIEKTQTSFGPIDDTRFTILPTEAFSKRRGLVPAEAGVYLILSEGAQGILENCGVPPLARRNLTEIAGRGVLYVGSSTNMRARLAMHIAGSRRSSDFRLSLFALHHMHRCLGIRQFKPLELPEAELTAWIADETYIGYFPTKSHRLAEDEIIKSWATICNSVQGRFLTYLVHARDQLRFELGELRGYRVNFHNHLGEQKWS